MRRPLVLSLLVAIPLVVAVVVLSMAVVRADRAEVAAAQVRLALWRLDAQAGALLVAEASSAPEAYRAFYAVPSVGGSTRALMPSPLLALPEEPVLLHVQIESDGRLSSPQVPDRSLRNEALANHITAESMDLATQRLTHIAGAAQRVPGGFQALVASLPQLHDRVTVDLPTPGRSEQQDVTRAQQAMPTHLDPAATRTFEASSDQSAAVANDSQAVLDAVENLRKISERNNPEASIQLDHQGRQDILPQEIQAQVTTNDYQQRFNNVLRSQFLASRNNSNKISSSPGDIGRNAAKQEAEEALARAEVATTATESQRGPTHNDAEVKHKATTAAPIALPSSASADRQRSAVNKIADNKDHDSTVATKGGTPPPASAIPTAARAKEMVGMADPKTRPLATDSRSGGTFGSRRIAETRVAAAPEPAKAGPMQAHWLDDHLLLMRRARLEGRQVAQAAVVDWPLLRSQLIAEVQDILPGAGLVPATAADALELRLAALPVRLDPGTPAATELRPAARWTLAAAWLGTAIGMAGAALLLTLAHRLGERRATFVSAVTHELRTPLTSMRLHADLLADQRIANDPHKRAGRIAVLRSEAGRLAHLIDNVLDYARLERRKPPAPKRVVLSELIEPLLPRLSERLAAAGLALECQPLPAATVSCDQAAVERILANLADNAAKYAAQAEDPSVVLRVLIADRRLELRLRDHGPGLAPDVRERLFVPFARSAEAAAGNAPGVGLGLALCRRLARAQGGDLRLDEPADGSGVEVVLTLPLAG